MSEQNDVCEVSSCENLISSKKYNLCNAHYLRYTRHGSVQEDKPLRAKSTKINSVCEAVGCTNLTRSSKASWCSLHYYNATSFYKRNSRETPYVPKTYTYSDECVVEGCSESVYRLKNGMCYLHARRNEAVGSPGPASRKKVHKYDESTVCAVSSCNKRVSSLSYCDSHYSRLTKSGSLREDVPLESSRGTKVYVPDKSGKKYFRYFRFRDSSSPLEVERFDFSDLVSRDGTKCSFCLKELDFSPIERDCKDKKDFATLEHLLPLSRGGSHTLDNVVMLCWSCNSRKNNKTVEEYYNYEVLKNRLPSEALSAIKSFID